MTGLEDISRDKRFFWSAVFLASFLHISMALACMWVEGEQPAPQFTPLAHMDFSPYDPDGGQPGDGNPVSPVQEPEVTPAPPQPLQEPETPPEPPEDVKVVESKAEEADTIAPPPPEKPKKKVKPKPVAKPTPKPVPQESVAQNTEAQPQSGNTGSGPSSGNTPGQGRGGSGGGTGKGNSDAEQAYLAHIIKKLNRHKKYPSAARNRRLDGVVTVSFSVDRQGQVSGSRLVTSSGHPPLDQEAMALLKRATPFQPMPEAIQRPQLLLNIPIQFSLR